MNKLCPGAETPVKELASNIGWDVTLISRTDNRAEDTVAEINEYGTGLCFSPPEGYYLEVIGTNSLYRHGYMLPGPVIIDNTNKGELVVPLYKFKDTEDISLPFRAVRIIPRPTVYIHVSQQKKGQGQRYIPPESSYSGDMNGYQGYKSGVPRPHALPQKGGNHMF